MWGLLVLVAAVQAREISDEQYALFPRLYHLDDYDSCLAKPDGLYCLGTFHIHQPKQYDYVYELMKEYSEDPHHFNRTRLHRGYCVSERCPSVERNNTHRFERCAALWGRKRKLRLSLQSLSYCKTHAQEYARKHNPEPYDLSQKLMVAVTVALCLLNLMGTLHDVIAGGDDKENSWLSVWSIRSNWRRLRAEYEDGDPRLNQLQPVQGVRVFLMLLIIGTHAACIHDMLFVHNPRYIEKASRKPALMLFLNGTSVVMIFVMISAFLLAYNLLLFSEKHQLKLCMLKWCVAKRVARISPVSLLVVGFAATFWPHLDSGPMWPTLVEPESKICRQKFWYHAFYINNLVYPDNHCLVQTWFLATDMQLYIICALLTLWLANKRHLALPVLSLLMVASCVLNGLLAYYFGWKSILYHVYPEAMHTMYRGVASFYLLYTAPWGALPAALAGLLLAHLHYGLQRRGILLSRYRWFRALYRLSPLLIVWWLVAGHWVRRARAPAATALYAALERPVLSVVGAATLLGLIHGMDDFLARYFSWGGWRALGRMSLSVLMLHWPLNAYIAAARPQPIATSLLYVVVDTAATASLTYLAALPLTIMVEQPAARALSRLLLRGGGRAKGKAD